MDSLFEAGEFVRVIEKSQGLSISVIEEIAYRNGWIDINRLLECAARYGNSPYGIHLQKVAQEKIMTSLVGE